VISIVNNFLQTSAVGPHFLNSTFWNTRHLFNWAYFSAHPTTLLLKILGGRMHGPSPTSNFGGTVPPVPLGFCPCVYFFIEYAEKLQHAIGAHF